MSKLRPPRLWSCTTNVLLCLCLGLNLARSLAAQTTIRIPQDQPTIQAGIDAASNGDTVLVSPGTYAVALDFKGKAVTVTTGATSASDSVVAATVLTPSINPGDGFGPAQNVPNPIAVFLHGEGNRSVLNGFTIHTPAQAYYVVTDASDDISATPSAALNSTNQLLSPGDIFNPGSPTITNNRFNSVVQPISLVGGVVAGNQFTNCTGDGITVSGGSYSTPSLIHDNLFENNTFIGFVLGAGQALVYNNILRNNIAGTGLSSVTMVNPQPGIELSEPFLFAQNLIVNNQMDILVDTVAISANNIEGILANNTFAGNYGSPLCTGVCNQRLLTFTKNSAFAGNDLLLANNIFQDALTAPGIACFDDLQGPYNPVLSDTLQLDHNLFSLGNQPVLDPTCRQQIVNAGNLSADPQFTDAANGDFHLQPTSPAVDGGNNSILAQLQTFFDPALAYALTADLDGNPRPLDATGLGYPVIDIGAYELTGSADYPPTTLVLVPSSYLPQIATSTTLTAHLGSALGTPTGTVTLTEDGNSVGTAPIQADGTAVFHVTVHSVGVHEFLASYPGSSAFSPATSLKLVLGFREIATTLLLTATPHMAPVGTPITLTVNASAQDGSIPSPIALTDNGNPLGTVQPDASGNATLVVNNFTPGTHVITASYDAPGPYVPVSAITTVVITQNDFSLSLNPPTLTVASGAQGSTGVLLTSLDTFAGAVTLSAAQVPSGGAISFNSPGLTLTAGGTSSTVLLVNTAAPYATARNTKPSTFHLPLYAALLPLALLPLAARRRRKLYTALCAALLTVCLAAISGCSNNRIRIPTLAPGTYLIPITGTDPATGTTHTASLTLIVTR